MWRLHLHKPTKDWSAEAKPASELTSPLLGSVRRTEEIVRGAMRAPGHLACSPISKHAIYWGWSV